MAEAEGPYALLRVGRKATQEEIREAYFAQVRQHPPERDPEAFKRIRAAYDQLRVPEKRAEADMAEPEAWPAPARRLRLPRPDLGVDPVHVLQALKAESDVGRADPKRDFREVDL